MSAVRLARPTVDTPFHISLMWWEQQQQDIMVYIREALCRECRDQLDSESAEQEADYIDPKTGEVRRLNGIWGCLVTRCSRRADFLAPELPIATAIFRALLASGNAPLSPSELHRIVNRSNPQTILRVLTGPRALFGVVPAP